MLDFGGSPAFVDILRAPSDDLRGHPRQSRPIRFIQFGPLVGVARPGRWNLVYPWLAASPPGA